MIKYRVGQKVTPLWYLNC